LLSATIPLKFTSELMENVEIFVGDASSGGSVDGTLGFRALAEDAEAVLSSPSYVPAHNSNGEWGRLPSSRKPSELTSDLALEISTRDSRLSDQLQSSTLSRRISVALITDAPTISLSVSANALVSNQVLEGGISVTFEVEDEEVYETIGGQLAIAIRAKSGVVTIHAVACHQVALPRMAPACGQ
jgi:hypothetical protein